MELYKNKYRVESIRLKGWDYSKNGYYFITICTKNRICFFGEIVNGEMNLSETGKIAWQNLSDIPKHFGNIEIDKFIIMPNHIHAIFIIKNNIPENINLKQKSSRRDVIHNVSSLENVSSTNIEQTKNEFYGNISPVKNSLSVIIRTYKSSVTRNSKISNYFMEWQPRFYEHIIQDEESLYTIRQYIKNNPENWIKDSNNPDNIVRTNKEIFSNDII